MEETLYDLEGNPIAYIAYDNNTIYLWNGTPVAYLEPDTQYMDIMVNILAGMNRVL